MDRLNFMMEQVKKIKNGIGIDAILDMAYKILGNPIAMNNTEYTLQAYIDIKNDDPIWQELISLGTFGEVTQKFFEKAGFIEEVANNKIAYLTTKYLKYDRINGKLFNKNNTHVSNLIIVATNKPFEKEDKIIFEIICKIMSNEIRHSEEIAKYEQEHQEAVIKNLIDGNYNVKMDIAQVEILYGSLGQSLYIAVMDISLSKRDAFTVRDLLIKLKPEYKYALYKQYVIMIISTNDDALNVAKDLNSLIKFLEKNNIYCGISKKFENLFELQKYYLDAVKMLDILLNCKCDKRIFPYHHDTPDKLQQILDVENGKGIQHFLNIGPKIFVNPMLFHDLELSLLAYSENESIIDPIWIEIITYGTSSNETIDLFLTEGFIETIEKTKGGALLVSKKIKYDRISWKIYSSDNIMIGCLSIVNTHKPFNEDELVLFGVFSQKLTKEISGMDFYNNYAQVYCEAVINKLLGGKIDDHSFYTENISNVYINHMQNIYLVVIDKKECKKGQLLMSKIRELFNWPFAINRYAIYKDYIIVIICTDKLIEEESAILDKLNSELIKNDLYAAISTRSQNIYDLQKHFVNVENSLEQGIKNKDKHKNKHIFRCDD